MFRSCALLLCLLIPCKLFAAIDTFEFASDENRERYQQLTEELRCPKCKNSNLAGSNSMIATDLKREIHTMVEAGDSEEKIVQFMLNRYGDFVLYKPRIRKDTLLLWGAPIGMLALGLSVVGFIVWRRGKQLANRGELSPEEQARLAELLAQATSTSQK